MAAIKGRFSPMRICLKSYMRWKMGWKFTLSPLNYALSKIPAPILEKKRPVDAARVIG
jgi:hypothetical protein